MTDAPDHGASADRPVVIDLDLFRRLHKSSYVDYVIMPTARLARPGNAGSNTVTDHIRVTEQALAQLPGRKCRPGKKVLIRTDACGGTHGYLVWLHARRLSFSIGYTLPFDAPEHYRQIPRGDLDPRLRPGPAAA